MPSTTGWVEVAERVYQRRYNPLDVTVGVVRGTAGLLLVDTRSSHREADEIRADIQCFGAAVRAVVNTHAHYDHTFGNYRFGPDSDLGLPIYGHHRVAAHLEAYERPMLDRWIAEGAEPVADWGGVVITPPTHLVYQPTVLDLGDRGVEFLHLGRGHTDNDLLVHVPDTDTWLVGDLVEESGPPMYGSGSFPLEWPRTLAALLGRVAASDGVTTVVPGHGAVVDSTYVSQQQRELEVVAELIREAYAMGVPETAALAAGGDRWPYPLAGLRSAVADGYRHLAETDAPADDPSGGAAAKGSRTADERSMNGVEECQ